MSVSTATGTAEVFEMGRVLRRTFGAIGRNAAIFFGLAAILAGIPQLIIGFWQADVGSMKHAGAPAFIAIALGVPISLLASVVLQVSITRATISDLVGDRPGFAACLKNGIALILPMIGLSIMLGLGVMLGLILLLVPGIMLFCAWSVAVPAYVQERRGLSASLGRSRALTKGVRWKIFALLLVVWIVAFVLQMPASLLVAAAHLPRLIAVLVSATVSTLVAMVIATLQATIYVELRDVKEGVSPQELETIFA